MKRCVCVFISLDSERLIPVLVSVILKMSEQEPNLVGVSFALAGLMREHPKVAAT
jgi:hypothetical protein